VNSREFLQFSTSQSAVRGVRIHQNLVDSTAVEHRGDPQESKAPEVEQVISEPDTRSTPELLLPEEAAVVGLDLEQVVEQEEAW
jgi:hypothetical protein